MAEASATNQRFRGTVEAVYADVSVNEFLSEGHEQVARAADHVHGWDGLRAVGHGGYGLRSADGENAVNAGDAGGGENDGIGQPVGLGWGAENDLFHSGDAGGDRGHNGGGGQRSAAARYVHPYSLAWAEERAVSGGEVHPVVGLVGFVVSADAVRGQGERFQDAGIHRVNGGLYRVGGDFDMFLFVALYEQRQAPYGVVAVSVARLR